MEERLAKRRLLVVADDTNFAKSVEQVVRTIGAEVVILMPDADVKQNVEQFLADVALFHVRVANTGVASMLRVIRTHRQSAKLAAVVSCDTPDDEALAKCLGFDAIIPLPSSHFVSTLCDLLESESPQSPGASQESEVEASGHGHTPAL